MGAFFSRLKGKLFGTRELRVLMLGLDNAGKTTILYKLKLHRNVKTIPTVGFNVETITGLIYVVDSRDRARIDEARDELHRILSDREMRHCVLLVFANKQDLAGAMSPHEMTERLGLYAMQDRPWFVHPSCAATGEGLSEGLQWMSQNIPDMRL
ncbi:hypothetical protein MEQU1_000686 [Malassezia equina]|uniref:ADP-ribosylation factor n=1 Tax=Malassezia equina TaxID=1381935 RepID=A0AAF0EBH0_9BASI|nr:hypothetical protein MEQU1_000686 [Malassezia equina]